MGAIEGPYPYHLQYFRFFDRSLRFLDDEGRPLSEAHARETGVPGLEWEFKRCPYSGKSNGKTMNVSALKQMSRHWEAYLDGLSSVRSAWLGLDQVRTDTLEGMWTVVGAVANIPRFAFYRTEQPLVSGSFPGVAASMFKAALDIFSTLDLMILERMAAGTYDETVTVTADEIGAYADENGLFLNGEWTCAASPAMVTETIEILMQGRAVADDRVVREVIPDFSTYALYVREMLIQYLLGLVFCRSTEAALGEMKRLVESSGGASVTVPSLAGSHAYHTRARKMALWFSDRQIRERVVGDIARLAERIRPPSHAARDFMSFAAAPPRPTDHQLSSSRRLQAALETPSRSGGAYEQGLIGVLLSYLDLERRFFEALAPVMQRIDEILQRTREDQRSEVLKHLTTPRDVVRELLHVEIAAVNDGYELTRAAPGI